MSFKVGDRIKGRKNNGYSWTNEEMFEARVEEVYENRMKIKCLKHEDREHIGSIIGVANDETKFELINCKPTKEELLEMPIGTKIITDRKYYNIFLKTASDFSNDNTDHIKWHDINDDLTLNHYGNKIIKVEEPTYTTVYNSEKEIKEMTVAEIEEALGHPVKIIKED